MSVSDLTKKQQLNLAHYKCPHCGTALEYKVGYDNKKDFIRCPNFPKCEFIQNAENHIVFLHLYGIPLLIAEKQTAL